MFDVLLFLSKDPKGFTTAVRDKEKVWVCDSVLSEQPQGLHHSLSPWKISIANFVAILFLTYTLFESFHSIEWPCYNINDCAVWLLSWNHVTIAILTLLLAITCRRNTTAECILEARAVSRRCGTEIRGTSVRRFWCYCATITVIFCAKVTISWQGEGGVVFALYNVSYLVPLAMECMVIVLCGVVRDLCVKVNRTLETMRTQETNNVRKVWNLRDLMKVHQAALNLLLKVTNCFDTDLLVDLTFNMVWFIIYIYITTLSLWKYKNGAMSLSRVVSVILEVLFLVLRVCALAYTVNSIENEKRKMLSKLRALHEIKNLNGSCLKLAQQFLLQITDSDMRMQICGCFYVDMSFIRGIIGLATTYLVIFIQYGLGDQLAAKPSNSTTTTMSP